MKYETAWIFYKKSREIARVCEVSDQAVSVWKKRGIIPIHAAYTLEKHSKGAVKVDPSVYTKDSQKIEKLPMVMKLLKRPL